MATRLKTVEFCVPPYTSAITDNTLTSLAQITVYIPETGTRTFRSVVATVSASITGTAAGSLTTRQLQCRLGGAAYVAHTNSNAITNSGEDIMAFHSVDLTAHFTTNFTNGTYSLTFDSQVLFDSAGTTPGAIGACVTLAVTYEYDDTSTTQIKTVRFPLNAPVTVLATSKPSAIDTLPALNTELPEASKTYRSMFTVVQGNAANIANTTDLTITQQWVSTTARTSSIFESALATDYWFRWVQNFTWDGGSPDIATGSTQAYYIYSNVARMNHLQVWLVVTYEFDASASNNMFVSLMLPNDFDSPMGGTTSSDYQRTSREFFVQETSVTSKQVAFFPMWSQIGAISTLQFRVGSGSFVTYTDAAAQLAGGNGAMVRNDAAYTIARGRNTFVFDAYRSDTSDLGWSLSGFWIVNYTCAKPSGGYGAANHTVIWNLGATVFDGAATQTSKSIAATAPVIPESDYYMTALGVMLQVNQNGTTFASSYTCLFEKTAAEGGVQWLVAYKDVAHGDVETGLFTVLGQIKDFFKRWPNDPGAGRLDIETSRRWVIYNGPLTGQGVYKLDLLLTYHTITYAVAGTIAGSGGGTVSIDLERSATGETVGSTSRSGNGAFSLTWYDNTENVYVSVTEDATHVGRSIDGLAGT